MKMQRDAFNAGKYVCALMAVFASSWAVISRSTATLVIWITVGALSAMYSFYWDIVQDWKTFSRSSSIPQHSTETGVVCSGDN